MYNVTQAFKDTIKKNGRQFKASVTIRDVTFDDNSIIDLSLSEDVNPSDSFMLGAVASNSLDITIFNPPGTLILEGARVSPIISLNTGSLFEDVSLGVFWVDKIQKDKNTVKLSCFDNMIKLEKAYFSNLSYPANINSVAQEICSKAGVEIASILPSITIDKIEGYTYREAIGFIASFLGGFARFNRQGKLEITSYSDSNFSITGDNYSKLNTSEKPFTIGKLTCKVEENILTAGTSGNEITFENPIMTQAQLNSIYNTLKALSYMPYTMDWQGNHALQAGDKITITDVKGNTYNTLLMQQKINYKGGLSASTIAVGKTAQAQEFNSGGSIKNKIDRMVIEQANIKVALIEKATIEDLIVTNGRIDNFIANTGQIADLAVTNAKIALATITGAKIANATIDTANIKTGSITNALMGAAAIDTANIKTGAITTALIANANITTALIADGSIINAKIVDGTIDVAKIKDATITAAKIADATITSAKIQDGTIVNADIANATITGAKIANATIGNANIVDATITAAKIANATITSAQIANATIDTANIKIGAITTALIGTAAVGTTQIADGSITDAKIVTLTASKITAGTIDAGVINVTNLNAANITVGTINGTQISSGAIDSTKLASSLNTLINSKVAQVDVDSSIAAIRIGARNLLRGTTFASGSSKFTLASGSEGGFTYSLSVPGNAGDTFTLGLKVRGNAYLNCYLIQTGGNIALNLVNKSDLSTTDYKYYTLTFTIGTGKILNQIYICTRYGVSVVGDWFEILSNSLKLESGTKATDWSSAPEDVQSNIDNAQTTANGKNAVKYSSTQPSTSGNTVGDVWFNISDGNKMYKWDGAAWTLAQFGTNAIANSSITNALIADATIQNAKIASVDAGKITTGTLSANVIGALSITGDKIAANTITASNIATDTITANQIAAGAVTASEIASRTITADRIVTGAITTTEIASKTIGANNIASNTITAGEIAANTITASQIASGTITTAQLASNVGQGLDISSNASITIKADKNYVYSRGQNLITNGTGLLGNNANFASLTYDGSDSYYSKGSFKTNTYGAVYNNDEFMPVDVTKRYKLSAWAKTNPHVMGAHAYIGIACYDCDNRMISPDYTMYVANTTTTLAQDLKNGDTVVYLTSAANWNNAVGASTWVRKLIFWDYKNDGGYQYPIGTYSRHISASDLWADGSINYTNNTITLRAAWSGGPVPAGTSLSQGSSGGSYKYITNCLNTDIPAAWTNYTGTISGVDLTGSNIVSMFHPGTASIRLLFLLNRDVAGSTTWLSNISFGVDEVYADGVISSINVTPETIGINASKISISGAVTLSNWSHASDATKIDGGDIYTGSITANKLTANTITAASGVIANLAITNAMIADTTITAVKIANATITATQIANATITNTQIANATIGTAQIANLAVTTALIADLAVTDGKINSLSANKLTAGTIDASKISVVNLNASNITSGTISGDRIVGGTIAGSLLKTSNTASYVTIQNQYLDCWYNGQRRVSLGFGSSTTLPSLDFYSTDGTQGKMWWNNSGSFDFSHFTYFENGIGVMGGNGVQINGSTTLTQGANSALRVNTPTGWIDIGSANGGWAHFYTDRSDFYFDKNIQVNGRIQLYNGSLYMGYNNELDHPSAAVYVNWRGGSGLVAGNGGLAWGPIYGSTKNAITATEEYGNLVTYADESPNHVFVDRGRGLFDEKGECYIYFDPKYTATVNTKSGDYWVQCTPFEGTDVKIRKLGSDHMVFVGTPNGEFMWEVTAERLGMERLRWNDADIYI